MDKERLVELYNERVPSSLSSAEGIEKDIAFLLKRLTGEQIFFSINYLSKYHPESLARSPIAVSWYWRETERYYNLAKVKRDTREVSKESEVEYDQRNSNERADTPSWFRKSFDKHMFE